MSKPYRVSEGGKIRVISGREVLARTLFKKGSTGDLKAIASIFAMEPLFAKEWQSRGQITSDMSAEESAKAYIRIVSGI